MSEECEARLELSVNEKGELIAILQYEFKVAQLLADNSGNLSWLFDPLLDTIQQVRAEFQKSGSES